MRNGIVAQSFGCLGLLAFRNGLLLLYLAALGVDPSGILTYLSLGNIVSAALMIPFAFLSDRYGKKRVGVGGQFFAIAGFGMISLSAFASREAASLVILAGIVSFWVGSTMMMSGWFALLSPIVPADERGRFFGRLRISWNLVGVVFAAGATAALTDDSPPEAFQILFALIAVALFVRLLFYRTLPELEPPRPASAPVVKTILAILRTNNYASFVAYVFLLTLFTTGVLGLFGLVEKKVLLWGDDEVVWMANLTIVGSLAGFGLSGRAVDRYGTKVVFLACHFGFALVMLAFLGRAFVSASVLPFALGVIHFALGMAMAASSISISTEILALIPPEDKSLSTAVCTTLQRAGQGLSGLICAWMLRLGILNPTWTLFGREMTSYDTLVLLFACMIVVLVVALGLVPSVLRKAEWLPRGTQ